MQVDIEKWLAEGDLTNDGRSDEVVSLVKELPAAFEDVFACLQSPNPVVRGHTADALEKIGRKRPDLFLPHIDQILLIIEKDTVPMVQWHLAMLLGHLAVYPQYHRRFAEALIPLVAHGKSFTQSWAITSLAILARLSPDLQAEAVQAISDCQNSGSAALRKRAERALAALVEGGLFIKGWVKSPAVQQLLQETS
jgi:hypothetical protein